MTGPGEPAAPAGPGQVILLNGASSSGKSSIAAELQEVMDRPWFHLPVDAFNSMRARRQTAALDEPALAAVLARTRARFHRAVAGMAWAGNDVIADLVLSDTTNTTAVSARDCALAIRDYVARGPAPRAFGRLRGR